MDTQRFPEQDGSLDATDEQRREGLIEQIQADIADGHVSDPAQMLRERLDESGIVVSDEEFLELLARLEH